MVQNFAELKTTVEEAQKHRTASPEITPIHTPPEWKMYPPTDAYGAKKEAVSGENMGPRGQWVPPGPPLGTAFPKGNVLHMGHISSQWVAPAPASYAGSCAASIQAIEGGESTLNTLNMTGISSLMADFVKQRPTLTNKYQGGWKPFSREWNRWLQLVQVSVTKGLPLPDPIALELLKPCLDASDQALLKHRQEVNEALSYQEFFEELQALYERDTIAQSRHAWQSLKLPPGDLTMEKWVKFCREFELLRDRVEDRTSTEEVSLLYASLPQRWRKLLLKEEAKRRKGKYLVKLTGVPSKPPPMLHEELETLLNIAIKRSHL